MEEQEQGEPRLHCNGTLGAHGRKQEGAISRNSAHFRAALLLTTWNGSPERWHATPHDHAVPCWAGAGAKTIRDFQAVLQLVLSIYAFDVYSPFGRAGP